MIKTASKNADNIGTEGISNRSIKGNEVFQESFHTLRRHYDAESNDKEDGSSSEVLITRTESYLTVIRVQGQDTKL